MLRLPRRLGQELRRCTRRRLRQQPWPRVVPRRRVAAPRLVPTVPRLPLRPQPRALRPWLRHPVLSRLLRPTAWRTLPGPKRGSRKVRGLAARPLRRHRCYRWMRPSRPCPQWTTSSSARRRASSTPLSRRKPPLTRATVGRISAPTTSRASAERRSHTKSTAPRHRHRSRKGHCRVPRRRPPTIPRRWPSSAASPCGGGRPHAFSPPCGPASSAVAAVAKTMRTAPARRRGRAREQQPSSAQAAAT
mmetsp:Transcript_117253/g.338978  ORF Transcript_117253/g.338978 Transcript_117253/m.338978 type:complete len:247 (-) Transcript_117253:1737-2477(-)